MVEITFRNLTQHPYALDILFKVLDKLDEKYADIIGTYLAVTGANEQSISITKDPNGTFKVSPLNFSIVFKKYKETEKQIAISWEFVYFESFDKVYPICEGNSRIKKV